MREAAYEQAIGRHYSPANPTPALIAALATLEAGSGPLRLEDLAPLDQFHSGGLQATVTLAQRVNLQAGMRVLDVGGGVGGPARLIARDYGCRMTVLDLTEDYCQIGELLTQRTGQSDRVTFMHGSALQIPFPDHSFDIVWT